MEGTAVKKFVAKMAIASLALGVVAVPATTTTADAAVRYKNCASLTKKYPHGVKKAKGTLNRYGTKGHYRYKATLATTNAAVYRANTRLDADKDGIACER